MSDIDFGKMLEKLREAHPGFECPGCGGDVDRGTSRYEEPTFFQGECQECDTVWPIEDCRREVEGE